MSKINIFKGAGSVLRWRLATRTLHAVQLRPSLAARRVRARADRASPRAACGASRSAATVRRARQLGGEEHVSWPRGSEDAAWHRLVFQTGSWRGTATT